MDTNQMAGGAIGLLAILGVSGLGRLVITAFWNQWRPARYVYLAAIMLAGIGLASTIVQMEAIAGTRARALRLTAYILLAVGVAGHLRARPKVSGVLSVPWSRLNLVLALTILIALTCCVAAAIAPSTKIDELHYHMLVGRRVIEDGGLQVYQSPVELTIIPQTGYQIFESIFYAVGRPDAGNLLSLGFGSVLLFFVFGLVRHKTQSATAGLVASAVIATGIYPAVWYVTSGPHALGDLALVVAVAAVLWPDCVLDGLGPRGAVLLTSLASAIAASTKVSLVPIAALITLCACMLPGVAGRERSMAAGIAAGVWAFILGPLVSWSWVHTGAPFGAAFANFFGHTVYQTAVFETMEASRKVNQTGLISAVMGGLRGYNGPLLVLCSAGLLVCAYRRSRYLLLAGLMLLQVALISKLLPHDLRFLGGLQYVAAMAAVINMPGLEPKHWWHPQFAWIAVGLIPWLGVELYYARPFFAVDTGVMSRSEFLKRYVAFTGDFRALDSLLPAKCELYISNARGPSIYFPRRVIYSLADHKPELPLYEFSILRGAAYPDVAGLQCGAEIYRNPDSIIEAYRTPGARPLTGAVGVRSCDTVSAPVQRSATNSASRTPRNF